MASELSMVVKDSRNGRSKAETGLSATRAEQPILLEIHPA